VSELVFYDHPVIEPIVDGAVLAQAASGPKITRAVLSSDQISVYDAIMSWLQCRDGSHLTFGGLAGTGKTTLISVLASETPLAIAFAAYTGKAASVLGRKLKAAGVYPAYCGTIHGLIYRPVSHEHSGQNVVACSAGKKCERLGKVEGWKKSPALPYDLIVLDEASMVGSEIWEDLRAYGLPILAVGDHGQLPPVGSGTTNLLSRPDLKLEKIHRQAAGNPILTLAHHVRDGGEIEDFRSPDDRVRHIRKGVGSHATAAIVTSLDGAAICYFNRTRTGINSYVRKQLGRSGRPLPGDVVICLKNSKPVWNGMRGICTEVGDIIDRYGKFFMAVDFPDERLRLRGYCNQNQFGREKTFDSMVGIPGDPERWSDVGMLFDFGYALTCHKAQGSQWKDVVLIVEGRFDDEDMRARWQYTAVTRAAERLHIVL